MLQLFRFKSHTKLPRKKSHIHYTIFRSYTNWSGRWYKNWL